jgi:succinate dehydrogenase / fumarate reductase iron-sulfur subunit
MSATATFRIWRGDKTGGAFRDYTNPVTSGMVVLDAVHQIQQGREVRVMLG